MNARTIKRLLFILLAGAVIGIGSIGIAEALQFHVVTESGNVVEGVIVKGNDNYGNNDDDTNNNSNNTKTPEDREKELDDIKDQLNTLVVIEGFIKTSLGLDARIIPTSFTNDEIWQGPANNLIAEPVKPYIPVTNTDTTDALLLKYDSGYVDYPIDSFGAYYTFDDIAKVFNPDGIAPPLPYDDSRVLVGDVDLVTNSDGLSITGNGIVLLDVGVNYDGAHRVSGDGIVTQVLEDSGRFADLMNDNYDIKAYNRVNNILEPTGFSPGMLVNSSGWADPFDDANPVNDGNIVRHGFNITSFDTETTGPVSLDEPINIGNSGETWGSVMFTSYEEMTHGLHAYANDQRNKNHPNHSHNDYAHLHNSDDTYTLNGIDVSLDTDCDVTNTCYAHGVGNVTFGCEFGCYYIIIIKYY